MLNQKVIYYQFVCKKNKTMVTKQLIEKHGGNG